MARKSSLFKELLAKERASQDKFRMVEKIKQQVQSGDYGEQVKGVIIDPEGHEKMSDVLDEFIEPYLGTVNNISDYKTLLMMGMIAWNASVIPEDKFEVALKLMTNELLANCSVKYGQPGRLTLTTLTSCFYRSMGAVIRPQAFKNKPSSIMGKC